MTQVARTAEGGTIATEKQDTIKICPSCLEPLFDDKCEACGYVPPERVERQDSAK